MTSVTTLIKQMKEKQSRLGNLRNKYKNRGIEIENIISEVKASTAVKNKLQNEEITKLEKLRETEMKHNHLKIIKNVWDMLLESNKAKLEEAETSVEQLQEAVLNNRITFCEDVRNFLDKYDLLLMSFGAGVERIPSVPIQATKAEESGSEKLLKNVASLEKILMDLTREAENIEIINKHKAELYAEPNEGQLFKNLRSTLTEVRNKVKDVETKIATVKEDIDKLMQGHKYQASKQDWMFPHSSTCSNSKNTNGIFIMSQSESSSSSRITSIETRNMDTENYNYVATATNVPKGILKMKGFTPKTPSAALRNHVLTNAHLDGELTEIFSRNYEQYQDSV